MRFLCLLIGLFLVVYTPAHAGHSPPKVSLRVHIQTTGDGLSAQEATTITLPPNGEQIQVRTLPELTERDLVDVEPLPSGGVRLTFDHTGKDNLNAVTSQNQGRILVVLIDGVIVYAPIIDLQITSGQLDIPHALTPQIIQVLQQVAKENVRQANRT